MSITIVVNGESISYPQTGDTGWGGQATEFAEQTASAFGALGLSIGTTVDIPGTLDVTGATTLDSTLTVAGTTTLNGIATLNGNTNLGNAITDTVTVTAILNVDSGVLYVNPATNKVGINDTTPSVELDVNGSVAITGNETVGGTLGVTGIQTITNTTDATNSTSGALIVAGGIGIAKKLFVGTDLDVTGKFNQMPSGTIIPSIRNSVPTGFLLCDGADYIRASYSELFSVMPSSTATITMTIASPCVVTWTSHGLATGQSIQFTTTGSLPTFSTVQTVYYIRRINANTFNLYTTLSNAMNTGATTGIINTSGSQSGTHTGLSYLYGNGNGSTTFSIPDLRGASPRGAGTSSGYIEPVTLSLGEKTDDQLQKFVLQVSRYNAGTGSLSVGSHVVAASVYPTPTRELSGYYADEFISDGTNGTPRVGTETRSKTQAVNFYIKF